MQRNIRFIPLALTLLYLTACAPVSSQPLASRIDPQNEPPQVTQLYFYPNLGQSRPQQDRDQYECYLWATQQTGFDPSRPNLAPHDRIQVVPQPAAGHDTVLGAAAGAVIGAAIGSPSNTGKGAVIGAMAGSLVGAASDSSREAQAQKIQQQYDMEAEARFADTEKRASDYRRAIEACLEGRGYTVR
jgi:hypothetical protein